MFPPPAALVLTDMSSWIDRPRFGFAATFVQSNLIQQVIIEAGIAAVIDEWP